MTGQVVFRWIAIPLLIFVSMFATIVRNAGAGEPARRPNIVVILADDLGYGDVRCLNPDGKIRTPHMDRIAAEGMKFTDAHSSSSVCTPTRYALLTGRYNWRSRIQSGVQGGMSPRLIEPGRATIASMLKSRGYRTVCLGKWHLGMDWVLKPDRPKFGDGIEKGEDGWNVDFTQPIANGPNSVGFDRYYGISASLDMVPYTFIMNDRVVSVPTVDKSFPMMLGREQKQTRKGPAAVEFEAGNVLPALTHQAVAYIGRAALEKQGQPFFMYVPLASPHTPIVPYKAWRGLSGLNPYADFVMATDAAIGQILAALDRDDLTENTLIMITSDNGCSPEADFPALLAKGHNPSYRFRGHKADIFEGGHRVPLLVRWPGHVKPGTTSDQTVGLVDIMATCAAIVGEKLADNMAEDSVSFLPALLGAAQGPLREAIVHHSINGSFAIRQGPWKLAFCRDSGGWSDPRPGSPAARDLPPLQLFNLADDPGEQKNVAAEHPEVVERLTRLMQQYVDEGRSTPGPRQTNTVPVKFTPPEPRTR